METFRSGSSVSRELQAEEILKLYDCQRGQKGVIVANGPSLRVPELQPLSRVVSFGFNRIFLAFSETDWRPDYYLVTDRLVAEQNEETIAELPGIKIFVDSLAPIFRGVENAIFVSPGRALLPHLQDEPSDGETRFYENWMPGDWNFLTGTKGGNSVTYFALKLAFWLGLSQVGVIGLDHRFAVDSRKSGRKVAGNDVLVAGHESNHFHKECRKPGDFWTSPQISKMSADFDRVARVFAATDRRVVNLTPESDFHGWPKEDLETFLQAPGGDQSELAAVSGQPRISVVMAVYNGERYLKEALESVLNQSYPPHEIFVVDDCSSDDTSKLVQQIALTSKLSVKILRNGQNEGQGFSLGRGISLASGDYIAFIDADDFWKPSRLEDLRETIISNPDAVLFQQQLACVDSQGESLNRLAKDYMLSGNVWQFMKSKKTLAQFVPTSGLAISNALTPEILPLLHNFRISADGFITRVSCRVGKVAADSRVGGFYRLHQENNTVGNLEYDPEAHLVRLHTFLRQNYLRSGELFDECLRARRPVGPRPSRLGGAARRIGLNWIRKKRQRVWKVVKRQFWTSKRLF